MLAYEVFCFWEAGGIQSVISLLIRFPLPHDNFLLNVTPTCIEKASICVLFFAELLFLQLF